MTEKTEKNKLLLAALLVVILGVVLVLQCVVVPMINESAALEDEIADARFRCEMEDNERAAAMEMMEENSALKTRISDMTAVMYKGYTAADFDETMSGYFEECSVRPSSLEVSERHENGITVISAEYGVDCSCDSLLKLIGMVSADSSAYVEKVEFRSMSDGAVSADADRLEAVLYINACSVSEDGIWTD
ncbi:MAG: hypothetical protein IJZ95_02515 [Oscillospiraceae bacterium]|nr:hypothetical protein [Oscillospiraceae bacterium]